MTNSAKPVTLVIFSSIWHNLVFHGTLSVGNVPFLCPTVLLPITAVGIVYSPAMPPLTKDFNPIMLYEQGLQNLTRILIWVSLK
jgi:hypothetical protein